MRAPGSVYAEVVRATSFALPSVPFLEEGFLLDQKEKSSSRPTVPLGEERGRRCWKAFRSCVPLVEAVKLSKSKGPGEVG